MGDGTEGDRDGELDDPLKSPPTANDEALARALAAALNGRRTRGGLGDAPLLARAQSAFGFVKFLHII